MTSPSAISLDTYYHIHNRGVNRENIFFEERNYVYFLDLYAKHIEPVAETFAYCLMRNHFHVFVKTKSEETLRVSKTLRVLDPSQHFSNFFNAYSKAINKTYDRTGSLFQHPYGRVPVTDNTQLSQVVLYIHQNPQKHMFVEDFRQWKYSSYNTLLADGPTRLQRETVLSWFGNRA